MPQMIFCDCGQPTEITGTEDTKQTVVIEPDSCIACSESHPEEVFSKLTEHARCSGRNLLISTLKRRGFSQSTIPRTVPSVPWHILSRQFLRWAGEGSSDSDDQRRTT